MTTNNTFRVYVANLAQYNNGRLVGAWISLPCDSYELDEKIAAILGDDEESAVHDYENDYGIEVSEWSTLHELNELAERLTEIDPEVFKAVYENFGLEQALEIIEAGDLMIYHDIRNGEDLAYAILEETGDLDSLPEFAQRYFDYEAYGRDLLLGGDYYIASNNIAISCY